MSSDCGICLGCLDGAQRIVSTPCGHVYHSVCLQGWLDESKTCPECRKKTSKDKVIELYFNFKSPDSINPLNLGSDIESLNALLRELRNEMSDVSAENIELCKVVAQCEIHISALHQKNMKLEHDSRQSLSQVTLLRSNVEKTKKNNAQYAEELHRLKDIQDTVVENQQDADEYLKKVVKGLSSATDSSVSQTLVHCCSFVKRDLMLAINYKADYLKQLVELKKNLGLTSSRLKILQSTIKSLEERIKELEGAEMKNDDRRLPKFEDVLSSEVPISQKLPKNSPKKILETVEKNQNQKINGLKRFKTDNMVRKLTTSSILSPSSPKPIREIDSQSRFAYVDLTEFTKNDAINPTGRNSFLKREQLCDRLKNSKILKRRPKIF